MRFVQIGMDVGFFLCGYSVDWFLIVYLEEFEQQKEFVLVYCKLFCKGILEELRKGIDGLWLWNLMQFVIK